jgi:quinol monooxygenase YgiN
MILATVSVVARPEKRKEVERTFRSLLGPTIAEPGCLGCHDSKHLLFITKWRVSADVERYIRSDNFRIVLSIIDLSSETPEVRFDWVSETRGMDYIEDVRGA